MGCFNQLCTIIGIGRIGTPDLRVRFSTSHPKDITDEVLEP